MAREIQTTDNWIASLDDDYADAVIHIAWDRTGHARRLVFGYVELLPNEVPAPIDDYDPRQGHRVPGSDRYLYVRHAVVSARNALEWYLACASGTATLPENDSTLRSSRDPAAKKLEVLAFNAEPTWPTLIACDEHTTTIPFCSQWIEYPRVHHLLPSTSVDPSRWWSKEGERNDALDYFDDRLHFSLRDWPEYWGSVHLVAPNPLLRGIDSRLVHPTPKEESVALRAIPRSGKSVRGLELLFHEEEPWGVMTMKRVVLDHGPVQMNIGREVGLVREIVIDSQRGIVLGARHGHTFFRSFDVRVQMARTVIVQGREPDDEYEVAVADGTDRRITTGETSPSARMRMLEAYYARERRRQASHYKQRWFSGKQTREGRMAVRQAIHSGQERVLVVDPYCGAGEIVDLLAIGTRGVRIRILTSGAFLKDRPQEERATRFAEEIARVKGIYRLDVHVMPGQKPIIHDRFILVDDEVWLLGSSLNEFGSRGTMMVLVPDPEGVAGELEAAWSKSPTLAEWLVTRGAEEVET